MKSLKVRRKIFFSKYFHAKFSKIRELMTLDECHRFFNINTRKQREDKSLNTRYEQFKEPDWQNNDPPKSTHSNHIPQVLHYHNQCHTRKNISKKSN